MRYDQKPVHRKIIVPWYDSETACLGMILIMVLVFLFALAGISVAGESAEHHHKIWLPILLLITSGIVIISIAVRLFKRFRHRYNKDLHF
jgi:hypothetical protein